MALIPAIKDLISRNKIELALESLRTLLDNSPELYEVLHHSARWADITGQIRKGTVGFQEAELVKNQIRDGLLGLIEEIQEQEKQPAIREEIAKTDAKYQIAEKIYNIDHINQANFS